MHYLTWKLDSFNDEFVLLENAVGIYIYIYTFSATLTFGFFNFKLLS
jgi:hypothetical protein